MLCKPRIYLFFLAVGLVTAAAVLTPPVAAEEVSKISKLADELREAEIAFAATMKARDLEAFSGFLSEEVVFFVGELELRGKEAVSDDWSRFFEGETAPFSWEPESVSVLDSGSLGLSSGPVLDPAGNRIGTFNSIWRRLPEGNWEIVFDRGCPPCK